MGMKTKPWPEVGIHPGIDPAVYYAPQAGPFVDWIVSKSLLWDFAPNPKRWLKSPPKTVTEAMRWGSLVDCLLLTPERFEQSYAVHPETYVSKPKDYILTIEYPGEWNGKLKLCREWKAARETEGTVVLTPEELEKASQPKPWNWNSKTCEQWRQSQSPGVEVIAPDTLAGARLALKELQDRPEVQELLSGKAQTQVGLRYDFGENLHGVRGFKVQSKSLIDIVPDRRGKWGWCLGDLKETLYLDDIDQVERTIYSKGYHAQAALYLDAWNALSGENREGFVFPFQLSAPPHEVAIVELDPSAIKTGREWYLAAIRKWAETVTSGKWTSPWDGVRRAELPSWSARKPILV